MKIQFVSDLHLESHAFTLKHNSEADAVVLAGDITTMRSLMRFESVIKKAAEKPTFYVFGNHEFYYSSFDRTKGIIRKYAEQYPNFHILDDTWYDFDGVRFAGSTMWTNFNLYGDQMRDMRNAGLGINDFHCAEYEGRAFTPSDALNLHNKADAFYALAKRTEKPCVFISHFVSSPDSIAERWRGSSLNPYFTSNMHHLMGDNVKVWIHGHTHDSCDHVVDGTHVVCNPRGYTDSENTSFKSTRTVEV